LELSAKVTESEYAEVTFLAKINGKSWISLGTSNRKTFGTKNVSSGNYRIYFPTLKYQKGATIEFAAVAKTLDGKITTSNIVKFKNSR
jgi:hypothetical protein